MTQKDKLYYLLTEFIKGKYTVQTFCDAYIDVFYPDFPKNELTETEVDVFDSLGNIISRFSPYEEDHKMFPGVYTAELEVCSAIETAIKNLEIK